MYDLEKHINDRHGNEHIQWVKERHDLQVQLRMTIDELDGTVSDRNKAKKELEDTLKKLEKFQKFDKTHYDKKVFKDADELYKLSSGFDKHYGRCLLTILKNRGIAKNDFERSTEFLNWSNAYKKYRSASNK
jgi:regulator of sirC expression with transglutaminase-like and TPR domain